MLKLKLPILWSPDSKNQLIGKDSLRVPSKAIQPVHPKGNQSWIFIGRTDAEAETPNTLATWCEELTYMKRSWCWEWLKAVGGVDIRGWDGRMASLTQWTWGWVTLGVGDGQGCLACCSPWGHKEMDTTGQLNWTEIVFRPSQINKQKYSYYTLIDYDKFIKWAT